MGHEVVHYLPEQPSVSFSARHRLPETNNPHHSHNVVPTPIVEPVIQPTITSFELSINNPTFLCRFERLQPRIDQIIRARWGNELDPYETDNLIQAAYIHLWMGYERQPEKFDIYGDGFWYATAKRGASNEFIQEFRQRYRQQGTGSSKNRQNIEVVVNSSDLLASLHLGSSNSSSEADNIDETFLQQDIIYAHDATSFQEVETRLDVEQLVRTVYHGTATQDHPRITRILDWMKEGCSFAEMARREGVKQGTSISRSYSRRA
jgi:DNA-directed RNA polymerase specialized sigma24 family protein